MRATNVDTVVVVTAPTTHTPEPEQRRARQAIIAAAACFVIAAAAGALLRFGLIYGLPYGALHENVRFAHTHLMYFGWVTPALFALIGASLTERTRRPLPRAFHLAIAASLVAGLLSFVPFLLSGYRPTTVLGLSLPLSMIASSLAVLAWYLWGAAYVAATWQLARDLPLLVLDAALLTLLVATTGAWGLALAAFSPHAPGALMDALVRFYLDLFSNGWFALALLGLLVAAARPRIDARLGRVALALLLSGTLVAAFTPLVGGPAPLHALARYLAAYGLLTLAIQLGLAAWRRRDQRRWRHGTIALLLGGKALVDAVLTLDAVAARSDAALLGVVLAHAYLLGLVTLALVLLALERWQPRHGWLFWLLATAVAAMLVAQLPLTLAWPFARGAWILPLASWSTLAPNAAMIIVIAALWRRHDAPYGAHRAAGRPET